MPHHKNKPEFQFLVKAGCRPEILERTLENAWDVEPPSSLARIRGGTLRESRAALSTIRKAAGDVKKLLECFAGRLLLHTETDYMHLPRLLESFIRDFEAIAQHCGPNLGRPGDISRAILTGYIQFATGSSHDTKVAALLNEQAERHQKWRQRHRDVVSLWVGIWRKRQEYWNTFHAGSPCL